MRTNSAKSEKYVYSGWYCRCLSVYRFTACLCYAACDRSAETELYNRECSSIYLYSSMCAHVVQLSYKCLRSPFRFFFVRGPFTIVGTGARRRFRFSNVSSTEIHHRFQTERGPEICIPKFDWAWNWTFFEAPCSRVYSNTNTYRSSRQSQPCRTAACRCWVLRMCAATTCFLLPTDSRRFSVCSGIRCTSWARFVCSVCIFASMRSANNDSTFVFVASREACASLLQLMAKRSQRSRVNCTWSREINVRWKKLSAGPSWAGTMTRCHVTTQQNTQAASIPHSEATYHSQFIPLLAAYCDVYETENQSLNVFSWEWFAFNYWIISSSHKSMEVNARGVGNHWEKIVCSWRDAGICSVPLVSKWRC